jgi:hypothetical protein
VYKHLFFAAQVHSQAQTGRQATLPDFFPDAEGVVCTLNSGKNCCDRLVNGRATVPVIVLILKVLPAPGDTAHPAKDIHRISGTKIFFPIP